MRLDKIRAVSFDLDDTLWPFREAVDRAEAVLHGWLVDRAPEVTVSLPGPTALSTYRNRIEQLRPELASSLGAIRRASIHAALADAGADAAIADEAYQVFVAERLRVKLFPDVLPANVVEQARSSAQAEEWAPRPSVRG